LELGHTPDTLTYLATAKTVLGEVEEAMRLYRTVLNMCEEAGDGAALAATLNNIGEVYRRTGLLAQALEYFHQALALHEAVVERAGESVTRYNMAMIYRDQGKLREAVEELRQVVALDEQVHSRDLESDSAVLAQVEAELGPRGWPGCK